MAAAIAHKLLWLGLATTACSVADAPRAAADAEASDDAAEAGPIEDAGVLCAFSRGVVDSVDAGNVGPIRRCTVDHPTCMFVVVNEVGDIGGFFCCDHAPAPRQCLPIGDP